MGHREPARAAVERGELAGAVAEDGHTQRVEHLERLGQIQEGLRPRSDGDDAMAGQRTEVGAHVAGQMVVAMNAADAAGREHGHADQGG